MEPEHYFVLLQLPGNRKFKMDDADIPAFFGNALKAIVRGKAKIISRRQDTGIAEELRHHAKKARRFKTYLLVDIFLKKGEDADSLILNKIAEGLTNKTNTTVIDTSDKFQLIGL